MSVKIKLTGKTQVIILAVVILLLSSIAAFLFWRVNQESTLAPVNSEAGGGAGACCIPSVGCVSGWRCDTSKNCTESESAYVGGYGPECGTNSAGQTLNCRSSFTCTNSSSHTCTPSSPLGTCVQEDDPTGPSEGTCKDVKCEWPLTLMSGRIDPNDDVCRCEECTGKVANDPYSCSGNPPKCSPGGCPGTSVDCGTSGDHEDGNGCEKQTSISCTAYHQDCNNPTVVYRYCKPYVPPTENVCDGGSWITKPTGNIDYDNPVTYSASFTDSDGIDRNSIDIKINNSKKTECSSSTADCYNISLTSSTTTQASGTLQSLNPGTYSITMSWKDAKGVGGTNCTLSTNFTVLEEETNPNWNITKSVTERCIDENTPNPKSELSYTIEVTNTGDGSGTIESLEDTLDTKVLEAFVQSQSITPNGIYSQGQILWNYVETPLIINSGASKTYVYKLIIDKENFGTYNNTVELTPVGSESIQANASIAADCEIEEDEEEKEIPKTGILDSTIGRISLGFTLLIVGSVVYSLPTMKIRKENTKYREKFEKKVANR